MATTPDGLDTGLMAAIIGSDTSISIDGRCRQARDEPCHVGRRPRAGCEGDRVEAEAGVDGVDDQVRAVEQQTGVASAARARQGAAGGDEWMMAARKGPHGVTHHSRRARAVC